MIKGTPEYWGRLGGGGHDKGILGTSWGHDKGAPE